MVRYVNRGHVWFSEDRIGGCTLNDDQFHVLIRFP